MKSVRAIPRLVGTFSAEVVRRGLSARAMYNKRAGTPKPSELKTLFKIRQLLFTILKYGAL